MEDEQGAFDSSLADETYIPSQFSTLVAAPAALQSSPATLHITSITVPSSLLSPAIFTLTITQNTSTLTLLRKLQNFVTLRTLLCTNWFGLYIPGCPGKQLLANYGNKMKGVTEKRQAMEWFGQGLASRKWLWNSQEVEVFCNNSLNQNQVEQV